MNARNLQRLKEIVLDKAFKYSDEPIFKLAYGGMSRYYFNCKPVLCDPEALNIIGELIFEKLKDDEVDIVGGLVLGAVPISSAVSLIAGQKGKFIKQIIIRDKEKDHGIISIVEGDFKKGEAALILDDVITTGTSTIKAIKKAREIGLKVNKVIILVDREEGGKENIEREKIEVESLVKKSEIIDLYFQRYKYEKVAAR